MTATYIVGDVFEKLAELRRRRVRVALVLCSPPFLALRSYLPDGHPLKAQEIGSEATPAAFVDVMLALVAECAHVLAPWGSAALELGDTYAGSGGAGGDYDDGGMREGQPRFRQGYDRRDGRRTMQREDYGARLPKARRTAADYPIRDDTPRPNRNGRADGWPMAKSLAGIPEAVMLSLAYGYNVLDRRGPDSPAGRWMIRNFKPWIRSNPPVGALGDKERPATSYVIVATRDPQRFFDLDAVRTPAIDGAPRSSNGTKVDGRDGVERYGERVGSNAAGAPPRDWCHSVDMVLDAELDRMAGKPVGGDNPPGKVASDADVSRRSAGRMGEFENRRYTEGARGVGARGVHLRRALERAGILTTLDAIDQSPKGYRGAHYAVWPPELVRLLVDEMCPRRVCSVCGQPSRRITDVSYEAHGDAATQNAEHKASADYPGQQRTQNAQGMTHGRATKRTETVGWSDCGCPGADRWQPGTVLDPFVGSGTTLAVCSGMGRTSIGIDLDYTNVELAMGRVGVFLDVEWPEPDLVLLATRALGPGSPHPAYYDRWAARTGDAGRRVRHITGTDDEPGLPRSDAPPLPAAQPRPKAQAAPAMAGQGGLFD